MTLEQFKFILAPGELLDSVDRPVNMNYNLIGGIYRVDAVAVRINTDNLQQLQNATKITLHIPESGAMIGIPLQSSLLPIRTVNREQVGNYYLYSIVEIDQQPVISTPSPGGDPILEDYTTDVIIEPSIANSDFIGSQYDALLNNTAGDRQSDYIQISDRIQSKPFPQNLLSILTNKAIPASVQDSNYTSTGWTKGRYDGSKTDSIQYGGIEPALIGGVFTGAFFPQTYTEAQIRALTSTDITYKNFFFSGKLDAPTCIADPGALSATTDIAINPTTTTLLLTVTAPQDKLIIKPGNLLTIASASIVEYCKVLSATVLNNNIVSQQVEVVRGFAGSVIGSFPASSTNIDLIVTNQFYTLESNRIQGLLAGKLLVQDSKEVLYINAAGYAISGSNAPTVVN